MAKNRHREALGCVDAGLALIDRAVIEHRAEHEVRFLVQGAACHWVLTGYACKQAAAVWARVEALIDQVTDPRLLVMGLSGILACAYVGGDMRKALSATERLVALGEKAEDIDSKIIAYASVGPVLHQQGRFVQCTKLLELVLDLYKPDRRGGFGPTYDPRVAACNWLGYCHLATGRFNQARQYAQMAVDHATAIAQPFVLSMALSIAARTFSEAGDQETAMDLCHRCIELCDAQNLPFWKGWAIASMGIAFERYGKHQQAETHLSQAIADLVARGSLVDSGYMYAWRAQALAHLGRFDEARCVIETGRLESTRCGQLLSLIELAYSRGVTELLCSGSDDATREHWFNVALIDSRSVGSRLMELRAATSLAGLWKANGKRQEAQHLLRPVVSAFAEGLDRQDVKAAVALLDSLDLADG